MLIDVFKKPDLQFVGDVVVKKMVNKETGEVSYVYQNVIKLKNVITGEARLHPFSTFLLQWRNNSPNTAIYYKNPVLKFLNYIYFELTIEELPSIEYLTFEHVREYLEYLVKIGKPYYAVKKAERAIVHFIYFLAKHKLCKHITVRKFKVKTTNRGKTIKSPIYNSYKLPRKPLTKKTTHEFEHSLIFEFLYISLMVAPEITLALYIQFFSGLRASEVLSLTKNDIRFIGPYGRDGLVVVIDDYYLREERKDGAVHQIKKPRNQVVFPVPMLIDVLVKMHLDKYSHDYVSSLFTNTIGNPMSYQNYYSRFKKVKEEFLNRLSNSPNPDYKLEAVKLATKKWGTHIGRGIFSNLMKNITNNAVELAVLRGDTDLKSALAYISDSNSTKDKLIENLTDMYTSTKHAKMVGAIG